MEKSLLVLFVVSYVCCFPTTTTSFAPVAAYAPRFAWTRTTTSTTTCASSSAIPETVMNEDDNGDKNEDETFDNLGLSPNVLSAAWAQNWRTPTPIQRLAIPTLLVDDASSLPGAAAWCQAPTGSGKTAAFLLPLLHKLMTTASDNKNNKPRSDSGVRALLLVPTRELAVQVGAVAQTLSHNCKGRHHRPAFNVQIVHGGVPMRPQLADLPQADIVVATPGRLVDLLTHSNDATAEAALERTLLGALQDKASLSWADLEKLKAVQTDLTTTTTSTTTTPVSTLLQNLEYLILDEADRLLQAGFDAEMQSLLSHVTTTSALKGTWLFSATFPKRIEPRVDALLARLQHKNVVRISCAAADRTTDEEDVSGRLQKRLDRRASTDVKAVQQVGPASTIDLQTIRLDKPQRTQALRKLLQDHDEKCWDRVLVFVATRYAAEHVARKLRRVGITSAELHGKLDQEARLRRLQAFTKGRTRVLLATDVASRGLDVVGLPVVVNYDLPRSTADFVHRIGRTGRAGRRGTAVTFVTPETEAHYDLIEQRHLTQPVERQVLKGFEPNEEEWQIKSDAARISIEPGAHSSRGLAHDRMHGGIKGRRKSKKDRLREAAARQAQTSQQVNKS